MPTPTVRIRGWRYGGSLAGRKEGDDDAIILSRMMSMSQAASYRRIVSKKKARLLLLYPKWVQTSGSEYIVLRT